MKKKRSGGGANWMDTYGDMVTLLLCFFVLLYSMSTIDQEAWKNLVMSFNPYAVMTGEAQGGGGPSADDDKTGVMPEPPENPNPQEEIDNTIQELYQSILNYIETEGMSSSITAEMDGGRIFVTFQDTAFFNGDSSDLRKDAYPILEAMSKMLNDAGYAIDEVCVVGHTAQARINAPNTTRGDRFLASNRATEVLVYIQDHTDREALDPGKLYTRGAGQWHPIADNSTEEGRAQNRRVELIISGRDLEKELGSQIESFETTK